MTDETTRLQARVKVLEDALSRLLEPFGTDACKLDHHGYCHEHFIQADCCVAYARTALSASQPADPVTNAGCCQPVQVKPLEWGDKGDSAWADHQFGWYEVFEFDRGFVLTQSAVEIGVHSALDAAKAAAQADYEVRILSALEPAPVTPAEAAKVTEIAALIEAADEALSEYWGQCEGPVIYSMKKIDAALAALKDAPK